MKDCKVLVVKTPSVPYNKIVIKESLMKKINFSQNFQVVDIGRWCHPGPREIIRCIDKNQWDVRNHCPQENDFGLASVRVKI